MHTAIISEASPLSSSEFSPPFPQVVLASRILMPRFVAFLRAINVGGHVVTMAKLRKEFEALGLQDVETFIASGNVIFTSRSTDLAALEKKIESRLRTSLGYEVATFVRTAEEVAALAEYKPFDAAQFA